MRARTFTESGRRAQIVTAAIEVIAEVGYANASFSRIAKHAGLSSTGMISYHFAGKDDLLAACVAEIEQVTGAYMEPRIDAAVGHVAQLRAYIEANLALVGEHAAAVRALIDLVRNAGSQSTAVTERLTVFENHFRAGQGVRQSRAGNRIDASGRRGRKHPIVPPAQIPDQSRADAAVAADHDDLHNLRLSSASARRTVSRSATRSK